jgi:hypothetical protein
METWAVADAPPQGFELLTFDDRQVKNPTPGEGPARVLSLQGHWLDGRVTRRSCWLAFEPAISFVSGMSGSPIVSPDGRAIGVVSVAGLSPVLIDTLPPRLLRSIVAPRKARKRKL